MFEIRTIVCKKCSTVCEYFSHTSSQDPFLCDRCNPQRLNFVAVETDNFKHYRKNGGNVSKSRINMIKSRKICPDGNGEVVMVNRGKITDKLAINY